MLGVAAATALPSEVFPFRKIFLPSLRDIYGFFGLARSPYPLYPDDLEPFPGIIHSVYSRTLLEEEVEALQLKMFAKEIPNLFNSGTYLYSVFKRRAVVSVHGTRIPMNRPAQMVVTEVNEAEKTVTFEPVPRKRSFREFLHRPAMPEKVMEFIDGLERDLS